MGATPVGTDGGLRGPDGTAPGRVPYYPVMLDLRDRPCVVLGGGREAEAKVRGLLDAGARVTLVAATATEALARWAAEGRIRWIRREYRPGDLAGFVLVIAATGDPDLNRRIRREADRRHLWVNAVDDPPHCSFILPAVHRQGDLVVAVGTGGQSPALAARLRDRLARELGPEYATWIALLGSMRPAVAARIPDPDRRRALWYRMVDSEGLALVRRGDVEGARRLLEALLDAAAGGPADAPPASAALTPHPTSRPGDAAPDPRADGFAEGADPAPTAVATTRVGTAPAGAISGSAHGVQGRSRQAPAEPSVPSPLPGHPQPPRSPSHQGPGTVYLVGAGPGDPELLTLRAARILAEADCVLYDRLVSPAVLARVRPGAERIAVGKAPRGAGGSMAAWSQEAILDLLADRARRHRVVVRLKGGDPMVFGRGGEELAELRRRGIPVQVVPGVTSAVAAPGLAGIPLTLRGVASSFTVASGHCQAGSSQDWARLAAADTLVVLMGVANRQATARALIEAGRPPAEPCAFVEWASWPRQRVIRATLEAVAAGCVQTEAPAVWIIGPVAAWADEPAIRGTPPAARVDAPSSPAPVRGASRR